MHQKQDEPLSLLSRMHVLFFVFLILVSQKTVIKEAIKSVILKKFM